ncbi:MAG: hypothetical protein KDC79_10285 [Cyclobacteriaceae bacterium]|nr:hypothetical protein [Cyclobacteriaceae bacterium]
MKKLLFLLAFIWVASGCGKNNPEPDTSFYLGFTPFPYSVTNIEQVMEDVYSKIASDGSLVAHHFDNGIPWNEALNNSTYPTDLLNDWAYRKSMTPAAHKVYVAVTPINIDRNGLAPNRDENGGDQPLNAPWNGYSFNDTEVKTAFLNYCKEVVDYFNPDYLAIGIEVNLLKKLAPTKWDAYVELQSFVYTELKKVYPELPVFVSYTGFDLAGYTDANQQEQQNALNDLLPYTDYFGLSLHPQTSSFITETVPSVDVLKSILLQTSKPVAICETSYPAQYASLYGGTIEFNGTPAKQKQYFENLLKACKVVDTRFVVNWCVQDYDKLLDELNLTDDVYLIWRDTGFYDENGNEREVLAVWKSKPNL